MSDQEAVTDSGSGRTHARPGIRTVVGIGASAGGLKAIETLFSTLPGDSGIAFIVVQHLSPDFKSLMAEILARHTTLQIVNIQENMPLAPDTVFLIPPNTNITVNEGRFDVTVMDREQIQRPIDVLFSSIGRAFGEHAAGVILSGTGSDGAQGIKSIYNAGGLTVVQTPASAQFDGMPVNAIATDCVKVVRPAEEIGKELVAFAQDRHQISQKPLSTEDLTGIRLVFSLLSERHGINFSDYKESTVARRLERRIHARGSATIQDYAELLRTDPAEVDALYHDLLIGVTKFFRDSEAFFALQTRINKIVGRLEASEELRIWVAGCATGEEAYTMAMISVEAFDRHGLEPRIKILATDVHQGALDRAARGIFSSDALEFVTPARQTRFFTPVENNQCRMNSEARRHIVFARHNVVEDPPFTKLHVVTCRNMLIYLQANAQQTAIASFHFGLEQDGLLMLGSSETPGRLQDEFETLDSTWRIYRKLRSLPNLLSAPSEQKQAIERGPRRLVNILNRDRPEQLSFTGLLEAYDLLLGEFVECALLLGENRQVLHVFGDASKFLRSGTGRFTGNIMRLLEGDARTTLGAALVRAAKDPFKKFVLRNVEFSIGAELVEIDVTVRALTSRVANSFVWFVEFSGAEDVRVDTSEEVRVTRPGDDYDSLEAELAFTRESLSATIEELETSNEELQSTNEELIASNEELQSTNQELHSVNEELYSVNAENHRKITELQEATDDIKNLLSSTDIGTVVVDQDLTIRRFTPAATRYFSLVDHDVGRPLANFTHNVILPDMLDQLRNVLETGQPVVRRVSTSRGGTIVIRIVPSMSGSECNGAILNLFDLDALNASVDSDGESN